MFTLRYTLKALAAAAVITGTTTGWAFTAGAHTFLSVGLFGRFNVVTAEDFSASASDQQCGFAAGKNVNLSKGYTIGKSSATLAGGNKPIGLLVGQSLTWTDSPSGTISGDVFLGHGANVAIAPDASVTLPSPYQVRVVTNTDALAALGTPETWLGYAGNTVNQVFGAGNYQSISISSTGSVAYQTIPLLFATAYNNYLGDMASKARVATANGDTQVTTHGGGKNIIFDGKNLTLKDMPGNALPNGTLNPNKPGAMRTVYIFDVKASDISNARYIGVRNAPETDSSLLNIGQGIAGKPDPTWMLIRVKADQSTVDFKNLGMQELAGRNKRVLWLFEDNITQVNVDGVGLEGTFIALKAKVNANNGNVNGTILSKSFAGTLEGHCASFENYLDPVVGP